ncbi:thrombospondin type-1 domain-containing protein 7B [Catharus ustulatus]|uniref:thrombospondin type-1 domain-containing protein 7B n=1 Tax=Catharus ustulatus TaxID=91951 RepID=UPI0014098359|nr:thrombospondin type-1 domain-containing protein 7B [Catharus ustulatus]
MLLQQNWVSPHWAWQSLGKPFLLFVFLMLQTADLEARRGHQFVWKTGHWGRCIGDCGSGGVRSRAVWCMHAEGWTTFHANCDQQDKPESQRSCFKVCDWHLELFQWEVSGWDRCGLVSAAGAEAGAELCVTAQHGLQRRSVRCLQKLNRTVVSSEICEYFSPQPPAEQACLVPCPRDCVVSQFSAWSPCGQGCARGLQHRTRAVIAPPLYGGAPCPNLTESRACGAPACPLGEEQHTYSLRLGPWGQCQPPHPKDLELAGRTMLDLGSDSGERSTSALPGSHPQHQAGEVEIGYQTRPVRCVRSDGKHVALSLCLQDPVPVTSRSCVMPKDCTTSEWSPWSPCSHSCGWGSLAPGLRSRRRSVRSVPVGAGKPCPELEEREACSGGGKAPLQPCPRFAWRTSEWKACQVSLLLDQQDPHHQKQAGLCGGGTQSRVVYCAQIIVEPGTQRPKEVARPVDGKLCQGPAPATSQLCHLPCLAECAVSSWSPWGPCLPESCQHRHGGRGFRMRQRQVVVDPVGTLAGCPHLVESIPCEDARCHEWVVSEGSCVTDRGKCGPGHRVLKAVCKSRKGEEAPHHLCSELPHAEVVACEVPCARDCVVSEWSPWSPCSHSCSSRNAEGTQSRSRSILALPAEGGKACPPERALQEQRACNEHPCVHFFWEASPWSSCSEDVLGTALNTTISWSGETTCGVGIQTRKVFCRRSSSGQVTPKRCPESVRPEAVRPCLLPCRKDCVVTLFSEWTPCPTACQPGNTTAVKQSRYRIILQDSANGGQACPDTLYEERECEDVPICPVYRWKSHRWSPCVLVPESVRQSLPGQSEACGHGLQARGKIPPSTPSVHEAVPCYSECNQYSWEVGPWSPCKINSEQNSLHCGEGIQTRTVRCVSTAEDHGVETVPNALCNQAEVPEAEQKCSLYCPSECAVSEWGQWSPCPQVCDPSIMQTRTRQVLRSPVSSKPCPEDSQMKPCILNQNCFQYQYNVTGWSGCQLGANATCGHGERRRLLSCQRSDGATVSMQLCQQLHLEKPVPTSSRCVVGCAVDCQLSPWSAWSQCSHSCGTGGQMVRGRSVVLRAAGEGRPCPEQLTQHRSCPVKPCYSWLLGPWSPCTVQGGQCGDGFQVRNLTCVVHDASVSATSRPVENALCGELPSKESVLQLPCSVPCPGDCHLTEWSEWSSCELTCISGRSFETSGRQSRSRAFLVQSAENRESCSGQEMETRPCSGGKCYDYLWQTSPWRDNVRTVWCQRSDGINVTGGCPLRTKPAEVQHCSPACRKPFSYCTQRGVCGCERGYTEVMRSNGLLDYCVKVPGLEDKKADVKTIAGKNKPVNSKMHDIFKGWSIQPFNPDGKLKVWVYGVSAGGFFIIVFLIFTSYLMCKKTKQHQSPPPQQKPLTLAYDGDIDM